MSKQFSSEAASDRDDLRAKLAAATIDRIQRVTTILRVLGATLFLVSMLSVFGIAPMAKWEQIFLLGLGLLCVAIPLFRKVGLSKDGGDVEMIDPIMLEFDLATSGNVEAPNDWRNR